MESSASRVTPLYDRKPEPAAPVNTAAEQGLLGGLLISNAAYGRVSDFLKPEHFGLGVHGRIFDAIGKLVERGDAATPVSLKHVFDQDGALEEIGGAQYLGRLAASAVTIINAESYARTIHDLYLRRRLIEVGREIIEAAQKQDIDDGAAEQLQRAEDALLKIADQQPAQKGFVSIGDTINEEIQRTEDAYKAREAKQKPSGIGTGLIDLDAKLICLNPTFLYVIGGRPGMGKSSILAQIAFHVAGVEQQTVAMFQLDESRGQQARRALAGESGVSSMRQRSGDLDFVHWERLVGAAGKLQGLPMFVDDTPALTVGQMRQRARRLQRQRGLGLIVVDHLQIMGGEGSRYDLITAATAGLKQMAKQLGVPVIAVSQLSRTIENRDDKRPQLADLREAGSIEQDADVVIFPYREEYYLARSEPQLRENEAQEKFNTRYERWKQRCEETFGLCELIIPKHRDGAIGTVRTTYDAETGRFDNWTGADRAPEYYNY